MAKSVITKSGSAREAGKDFCGKWGIRREELRIMRCPAPAPHPPHPPHPTAPHTHKADLLGYFDLADDASTDVVREVGGVTDAKGVRT